MPKVEKYTYKPLDRPRSIEDTDIRLIELLPGTGHQMIECSLQCFHLQSYPHFVAISYTWGSPLATKEIRVNNKRFLVRENLWQCLRIMRMFKRGYLFWIDAMCINQDDPRERNDQVQRMSLIYAAAVEVVIWLGPAADGSDLAMDYIAQKGSKPLRVKGDGFYRIWDMPQGNAVLAVCERPYWSRVWIIQEIMMAKDITVFCGEKSIEWQKIDHMSSKLKGIEERGRIEHYQYAANIIESPASLIIKQRRSWKELPQGKRALPLKGLLEQYCNQKSTDVRDKVFALLGLTDHSRPEANKHQIQVDYSKSVEDIYAAVLQSLYLSGQLGTRDEIFKSILRQALRLDSPSIAKLGGNFVNTWDQ